jgi:hypothetical protein
MLLGDLLNFPFQKECFIRAAVIKRNKKESKNLFIPETEACTNE